ncbi:hypothetical protein ACSQ67_012029 [Phaseolus vulgaris]
MASWWCSSPSPTLAVATTTARRHSITSQFDIRTLRFPLLPLLVPPPLHLISDLEFHAPTKQPCRILRRRLRTPWIAWERDKTWSAS